MDTKAETAMMWAGFLLIGYIAGVVSAFAAIMVYGAINDPPERCDEFMCRDELERKYDDIKDNHS